MAFKGHAEYIPPDLRRSEKPVIKAAALTKTLPPPGERDPGHQEEVQVGEQDGLLGAGGLADPPVTRTEVREGSPIKREHPLGANLRPRQCVTL